jgi:hypothetical protein
MAGLFLALVQVSRSDLLCKHAGLSTGLYCYRYKIRLFFLSLVVYAGTILIVEGGQVLTCRPLPQKTWGFLWPILL